MFVTQSGFYYNVEEQRHVNVMCLFPQFYLGAFISWVFKSNWSSILNWVWAWIRDEGVLALSQLVCPSLARSHLLWHQLFQECATVQEVKTNYIKKGACTYISNVVPGEERSTCLLMSIFLIQYFCKCTWVAIPFNQLNKKEVRF